MIEPKVILLVEDYDDDAQLTIHALRKCKVANEVVHVRDGAAALQWLFATAENAEARNVPALVLLDLQLPKVSGLDVLREIRAEARTRRLPVVLLSSSQQEEDLITGYDLRCNGYIRKPVNCVQFTDAVGHTILDWLVIKELPPPVRAHSEVPLQSGPTRSADGRQFSCPDLHPTVTS